MIVAKNNATKKKSAALFGICVLSLVVSVSLALTDALLRTNGMSFLFLGKGKEYWLVWEVAAIIGAFAGTLVFWLVQYRVEPRVQRHMYRLWVKEWSIILIVLTLAAFGGAAWIALNHGDMRAHLLCLCCGVLGFVLIQGLFLWDTANPKGQKKNEEGLDQAREDFRGALLYSDLPALGSFTTLLVVVCVLTNCIGEDLLRPFVGGIVAFELVTTTGVFVIEYWYNPRCCQRSSFVRWWQRLLS